VAFHETEADVQLAPIAVEAVNKILAPADPTGARIDRSQLTDLPGERQDRKRTDDQCELPQVETADRN
jgi:hypothetical protein